MKKSIQIIQDIFKEKNFPFFTQGDFNTNFVFLRKTNRFTNNLDDEIRIIFKEADVWTEIVLPFSTKAGVFYGKTGIFDPVSYKGIKGIAVVKEGFYKSAYKFVDSKWNWLQYPYFELQGELDVLRDNTLDLEINYNSVSQRVGKESQIQIHRVGNIGVFEKKVFNYSIGCLTTPTPYLDVMCNVARESIKLWGNNFSIALLEEKNL